MDTTDTRSNRAHVCYRAVRQIRSRIVRNQEDALSGRTRNRIEGANSCSGGDKPRTAGQHMLNEFKLHKDQHIDWDEDGKSFVLTATVTPSVMLRHFLHSQSDSIEIMSAGMRAEIAARVRRMDDRYPQEPCNN